MINFGVIIQARLASTRLSGKALIEIQGIPCLKHVIDRCRAIRVPKTIIVATTDDISDDPIQKYCNEIGVNCYRGSANDVLQRFIDVGEKYNLDVIERVTADCPLFDFHLAEKAYALFCESKDRLLDYVSNVTPRTYPRGLDIEFVSLPALHQIATLSLSPEDKEHVTLYIRNHLDQFHFKGFKYNKDISHIRWTLDTQEDLKLIEKIYEGCFKGNPLFNMEDALKYYLEHPEIHSLNSNVQQKIDARSS